MKKHRGDITEVNAPELGGVQQVTGSLQAAGFRFGLVVSRFNPDLTQALLVSAVSCLRTHDASPADITVVHVPGAFEIPGVLEQLAQAGQHHALIALGVVLQGETPHAKLISTQVGGSLTDISRIYGLPVIDGVIVADTMEQAASRATSGAESRGWYAARAAVEMATVYSQLKA